MVSTAPADRWRGLGTLPVLVAVACASLPASSHAQRCPGTPADCAQARELFNQGVQRLRASDWEGACEVLARSNAIVETAPTHMNLSVCSGQLGRVLDQSEHLRAYLRLAGDDTPAERLEDARRQIRELGPRIPRLVVHMPEDADDVELRVDGDAVPSATWGTPRPVNPGTVQVTASGPRILDYSETVTLEEGETRDLQVALIPRPQAIEDFGDTGTPERQDGGGSVATKWWFWTILGAVVMGAVLGLTFGLRSNDNGYRVPDFPPGTLVFEP